MLNLDTILANARRLNTGQNKSMQVTLDSTLTAAGVVCKVISLPDTANFVRITATTPIRAGLTELPETLATTATWMVGAYLATAELGIFALGNGLSRTLQLATASTSVVQIEIF